MTSPSGSLAVRRDWWPGPRPEVGESYSIYDGEKLLLLDWETSGSNDPFYDLAAIAVFLRMDEATCLKMLTAYDGVPVSQLPARFAFSRRLVAVLCGLVFLRMARYTGHVAASGGETLESTLPLGEVSQRVRTGSLNLATGEGRWAFGLALIKESFAL